jgi:hypothetical protein
MGGIDGHDQADRNAFLLQPFRELQRAASAHGVADQDDRLRILAVFVDRARGDQRANGEFVGVGG